MTTAGPRYRRRTFLALAGAGAAVACLGSTESPSPSPEVVTPTPSPSPRAAVLTGTLVVYSAIEESTTNELLAAFMKADLGVRMDLAALAAANELATRLRVEQKARKADLFVGGASAFHDALGKDGILEAYVSATGKLVVPDPVRADAGYMFLATQLFRFGRDETKTLDYLKQLHANVAQYLSDTAQVVAMVSRGDAAGAPIWGHDVLADATRKPGLQLLAPRDTGLEIGAVSIIKGTAAPAAARAFVEWVGGRDAQTLIAKTGGRAPTRALAPAAAGAPSLAGLDPTRYDRRVATDIRQRLLSRWREAVGRTD